MFDVLTAVGRHATSISHGGGALERAADARIVQSAKCRSFNSFRVWPIFIESIENAVNVAAAAEWTVSLFRMNRDPYTKKKCCSVLSHFGRIWLMQMIHSESNWFFSFLFLRKRIEWWTLNITQQFVCVEAFAQQMFRSPRFSSQRTLFTHEWTNKFAISVGIRCIQFGVCRFS